MTVPHDAPTIEQLVEAVREFLERDVMAATEGHVQFHTRVAVNVLRTVERELALGPQQAQAHAARLKELGFDSDAALAQAIRAGETDEDYDRIKGAIMDSVRDKLRVANPRYLE